MKDFGDRDKKYEKSNLGSVESDRYGDDATERPDSPGPDRMDAYHDDDRSRRDDDRSRLDDDRSRLDDDRSLLDDDRERLDDGRSLQDDDPSPLRGESQGSGLTGATDVARMAIFPAADADRFRTRWMEIQTDFVDEPRRSVEHADEFVSEVTERLISIFKENRGDLERQWTAGDEVSTEDLRQMLQRYRSFFERLLTV